jgi:hypothetical protein
MLCHALYQIIIMNGVMLYYVMLYILFLYLFYAISCIVSHYHHPGRGDGDALGQACRIRVTAV